MLTVILAIGEQETEKKSIRAERSESISVEESLSLLLVLNDPRKVGD
jgi:hypothetical protein